MSEHVSDLRTVDHVTITTVVDNFSDVLLGGDDTVSRPPLASEGQIPTNTLLGEHGLCLHIEVEVDGQTHAIILDGGYTNVAVPHNLKYLGLSLEGLDALVISHGHMDHTGSLKEILELSGKGTRFVVHPEAFAPRFFNHPSGGQFSFPPFPPQESLTQWGAEVVENSGPSLIAEDTILVSGEIPRATSFERGMPGALIRRNGELVEDTFKDDQSLVMKVGDKGLVLISGCAHSGIINSVHYAKELTGIEKLYAVIGGFHLSGPAMAPAVDPTITELKRLSPQVICPMHCTGYHTISRIADEMNKAFILNSVGSRISL